MGEVNGAMTLVHVHDTGAQCLYSAIQRARNTTIVVGADQEKGTLLLEIDVQSGAFGSIEVLQGQLRLIVDVLDGADLGATNNG